MQNTSAPKAVSLREVGSSALSRAAFEVFHGLPLCEHWPASPERQQNYEQARLVALEAQRLFGRRLPTAEELFKLSTFLTSRAIAQDRCPSPVVPSRPPHLIRQDLEQELLARDLAPLTTGEGTY